MQQKHRCCLIYSRLSSLPKSGTYFTHNAPRFALRSSPSDLCLGICCSLLWQCFCVPCCLPSLLTRPWKVRWTFFDVFQTLFSPSPQVSSILSTFPPVYLWPCSWCACGHWSGLFILHFLEIYQDVLPNMICAAWTSVMPLFKYFFLRYWDFLRVA